MTEIVYNFLIFTTFYTGLLLGDKIQLSILHVNDDHGPIEYRENGGCFKIKPIDVFREMPKIAGIINREKNRDNLDVLVINTGTFTNSKWSYENIETVELFNDIGIDYSSFGHLGVSLYDTGATETFTSSLNFPILCVNFNKKIIKNVEPSSTVNIGQGKRHTVGIIGYYVPHNRSDENFSKDPEVIQNEAKRIRLLGAKTIIAIGHSGQDREENFAKNIKDVDIFIGTHSNKLDDLGNPVGKLYPTWISDGLNKIFRPIEVEKFGKYITKLELTVDSDSGAVVEAKGKHIMFHKTMRKGNDSDGNVEGSDEDGNGTESLFPGTKEPTLVVKFEADACRKGECNFGNFITDAMIDKVASDYKGTGWTDSAIAFIHADMIKSSIVTKAVTKEDFETAIPVRHKIVMLTVSGSTLLKIIKYPVKKTNSDGKEFLQYSGVRVYYDKRRRQGKRIKHVVVRCADCRIPKYSHVRTNEEYSIICPEVLVNGEYGYSMIKGGSENLKDVGDDIDIIMAYVKKFGSLWYVNDRRIRMGGGSGCVHASYVLGCMIIYHSV